MIRFKYSIILGIVVVISLIFYLIPNEEPQGRLIKPFPKDTTRVNPHPECDWCSVVYDYSLNVNCHHYGDK
jgi:hypothetical protein